MSGLWVITYKWFTCLVFWIEESPLVDLQMIKWGVGPSTPGPNWDDRPTDSNDTLGINWSAITRIMLVQKKYASTIQQNKPLFWVVSKKLDMDGLWYCFTNINRDVKNQELSGCRLGHEHWAVSWALHDTYIMVYKLQQLCFTILTTYSLYSYS